MVLNSGIVSCCQLPPTYVAVNKTNRRTVVENNNNEYGECKTRGMKSVMCR